MYYLEVEVDLLRNVEAFKIKQRDSFVRVETSLAVVRMEHTT